MRDRLVTLLGAGVSLLLVIGLLMPPSSPDPKDVSWPTSIDRGENGLRGLFLWLQESGVPTFSLRRRYDNLVIDPSLNDTGNLLITSLPHRVAPSREELEHLSGWLEQGNYVLILAARNDWPKWALLASENGSGRLLRWLGFHFESNQKSEKSTEQDVATQIAEFREALREQRKPVTLEPTLAHGILTGVELIASHAYPSMQAFRWQLRASDQPRSSLTLVVNQDTRTGALWEVRIGDGGAWVASYPDLFGNITLGNAGNARLLGNILNRVVLEDAHVIFDDVHFGLTDFYDPKAFFDDPRLHNTLLFIGVFWLLYLLGRSTRLAPPRTPVRLTRRADFVEAMAGLFARRLDTTAVARGLLSHFSKEVRTLYRLPQNGEPVWGLLESRADIAARDLEALKRYVKALEKHRKPDLIRLTRILHNVRKALI